MRQSSEKEARSSQRAFYQGDVNETGFTQKLTREAGYNPSSISYSGDVRGQKRVQPPFLGTGYYDNQGRYVAVAPGQQPPEGSAFYPSSSQPDETSYDM